MVTKSAVIALSETVRLELVGWLQTADLRALPGVVDTNIFDSERNRPTRFAHAGPPPDGWSKEAAGRASNAASLREWFTTGRRLDHSPSRSVARGRRHVRMPDGRVASRQEALGGGVPTGTSGVLWLGVTQRTDRVTDHRRIRSATRSSSRATSSDCGGCSQEGGRACRRDRRS